MSLCVEVNFIPFTKSLLVLSQSTKKTEVVRIVHMAKCKSNLLFSSEVSTRVLFDNKSTVTTVFLDQNFVDGGCSLENNK